MNRIELLVPALFAILWGWICFAHSEALQRVATRLPRFLRYIFFDAFGLDPMGQEVYVRNRITVIVFLFIGSVVGVYVIAINLH
jgi:hypothetical protein